jgi:hypothetical protein
VIIGKSPREIDRFCMELEWNEIMIGKIGDSEKHKEIDRQKRHK